MGEARREVTIVNKRGLHARASARFVAAVAGMDGCQVNVAKDGHAAAFYEHHGFIALPDSPLTLFLPLATALRSRSPRN